jgi:FKBP12-rapamycin complex-associated protein
MYKAAEVKDPVQVQLALETLGTFDFSGHILSEFVRNCVVDYLEDDSPEIRLAAAETCCRVFARDPVVHQTSQHAVKLVGEVLEKLLTVAIADPDPNIRTRTLSSLDSKFDRHLAQAENVRSIFLALNDELFAVRELAIRLIGRLASHNPAYVMPPLRKTLIQLLTELQYATQTCVRALSSRFIAQYSCRRNRRDSSSLLSLLVASSLRLTKPYVLPILKVLLPKARDRDPVVAANIMSALGELARVGGEDVLPRLNDYMDLILEGLGDQTSPLKREAALKALGQLSSHTGYVIEPYVDHPNLLGNLIGILQADGAQPTRREAIKVMGILGALDPYRHTVRIRTFRRVACLA